MPRSKVYFLPIDKWKDVPLLIEKAAGNFIRKNEFVAIKLHFGEKGNKGFIKPDWVKPVVNMVKAAGAHPFLTDTTTIYRGQRSDAVNHLMTANGHGFKMEKVGAPVIIADGIRGDEYIDVEIKGEHYKSVKIAKGIHDANAMIVLSHTKGHMLSGFGGALKNVGMGCASKAAKYDMHAGVIPNIDVKECLACGACVDWCAGSALHVVDGAIVLDEKKCVGCGECIVVCPNKVFDIPWKASAASVQEKLVEQALGAVKDKRVCYVNYMYFITRNCDCMPTDEEGALADNIGIMIGTDPVAIDQASIDLINHQVGKDLFREMNPVDYSIHLAHAEKIGLGSREYELIK